MDVAAVFEDLFGRVDENVHQAVAGLSAEQLAARPTPLANSIGWLVWHLTRVQDSQLAELTGEAQVWVTEPWPQRFGLRADPDDHGYGHSSEQVAAVRPDGPEALTGYYDAVRARTAAYLARLDEAALDAVVDESWDPPVTLGVRLVSIVDDDVQHVGQAAYVRGLLAV